MHALITLLGRGRSDTKEGYRTTRYRFDDGQEISTAYFGLALASHLQADCLIMLGTSSSMWDVFVEDHVLDDGDEENLRIELMERVAADRVDQELLDQVAPMLSRLTGREIRPVLISMAREFEEQRAILEGLARQLEDDRIRQVSLDLTHGFRHLGMLGFLSAFVLERLYPGRVQVAGLWYGAHDMPGTEKGVSLALRLDGLQATQDWVDALNRFEGSGDYGVFAELLIRDGVPEDKARLLRSAAFRQGVLDIKGAQNHIRSFFPVLEGRLSGASGLFQGRLESLLRWAWQDQLSNCQFELALQALGRGNYSLAASMGLEGFITQLCEQHGHDPMHYEAREDHRKGFQEEARQERQKTRKEQAFVALNTLRNALVHGLPPATNIYWPDNLFTSVRSVLGNEKKLSQTLSGTIRELQR